MRPLQARRASQRRIAVVGAGPIGCATLAYLHEGGYAAALYSPNARRLQQIDGKVRVAYQGTVKGRLEAELLLDPVDLRNFDLLIVCLPAYALSALLSSLVENLRSSQTIVISGALSLSPLVIAREAEKRGVAVTVIGWGTTLTTAHFLDHSLVHINAMRSRIDMASIGSPDPLCRDDDCKTLFGDRFAVADNLLVPTLANINPIAHAAEVLPNLTRMEKGETWSLFGHFTPVVARLAEQFDHERLAVARGFGIDLPTLRRHYANSYGVPEQSLDQMAAMIAAAGMSPNGPGTLHHRYVLEDAPFGLAMLERLSLLCGVSTPMVSAALTMLGAAYGRDLRSGNGFLDKLDVCGSDAASLYNACAAERIPKTPGRVASACL